MLNILPIGSIVYLKDGSQKLMILNRGVTINQNGEDVLFDYSASFYPIGLNPKQIFYFNQEDIDQVIFEGDSDCDEKRFAELYKKWLSENNFKKGITKRLN